MTLLPMISRPGATSKSCASCKHQRRKCTKECLLAPYFPSDQPRVFHNAHRLFGVSNMQRLLKTVEPGRRDKAMETMIYQANVRALYPVHGCVAIINRYLEYIEHLREEINYVNMQIAVCKEQGSNASFFVHDDGGGYANANPNFSNGCDFRQYIGEPQAYVEDFYGNGGVSFDNLVEDGGHSAYMESLKPSNSSSDSNSTYKDDAMRSCSFEQGSSIEFQDIGVANFGVKAVKDEFAGQSLFFNGTSVLEEGLA